MATRVEPTHVNIELQEQAAELLRDASRRIVLLAGSVAVGWQFLGGTGRPSLFPLQILPITLLVVLVSVAAWVLSRCHTRLAHTIWQFGLSTAIVGYMQVMQQSELAFLLALLPMAAAVTVGWAGALLSQVGVTGVVWLMINRHLDVSLPDYTGGVVILVGALAGLLGWAATESLFSIMQWSLLNYAQLREKNKEAQNERLELMQIQQDLIRANNELARLTDQLKVATRAAEEARRIKEEFVANVSHELRTPLNMIIGFSETMIHSPHIYGGHLPPLLLADVRAIHRNSQQLLRLINDVLDLSQIDAGYMGLVKQHISLHALIDDSMAAVQALYASKGLYLKRELPDNDVQVLCDGTRVRQIMLNLLSNAGRFTERGGVVVKAWRDGDHVVVSVSDTGPGISRADQARLFEPFSQLDATLSRRHGGNGLGLTISKRFVEMHGGRMWLESEPGAGTTFFFSLPLDVTLAEPPASSSTRWLDVYGTQQLRDRPFKAPLPVVRPRLLVVESGNTLQHLLRRYLNEFDISSTTQPEAAIEELNRLPCQAVIINQPPDGTVSLASMNPTICLPDGLPTATPVLSCWLPGEDEVARRLGAQCYLIKPITRDKLVSALNTVAIHARGGVGDRPLDVLMVDDDPETLQLFARMLSSGERRYRILRATDGAQALDLLRQRQPAVMLLDLIMPGMDGYHVLREKNRDPAIRSIPVIITSSRDPTGSLHGDSALTITRAGGLSAVDLLRCIRAVIDVLSPRPAPDDPEQPAGRFA